MPSFVSYPSQSKDQLLFRLCEVTEKVANAHADLANMLIEKERSRLIGYGQPATSVKAMELNADRQSSSANEEVIEARGTLAALVEEKELIIFLITHKEFT